MVRSLVLLIGCGADPATDGVGRTDAPPPPGAEALCAVTVECWGSILDDPKTPCALQVIAGDGTVAYEGSAGLELRGRSSLYYPKKQYAVELRDHHELPVWPGATWRYLDHGSDPGAGWNAPGFDDAGWAEGSAPLGYGQDWLQTTVATGATTTYYRTTFALASPPEVTRLELGLKADDGAAVWLNGHEVVRENLPAGAGPDTPAGEAAEDGDWLQVDLGPEHLTDGENLLAVEVHQAVGDEGDLRFDLYLEASGEDHPVDLLGMGVEEDWILNGQYVDRVLWRNRLAYDLFASFDEDRWAPELGFCQLELDGEYQGIYTLGERVERDDDRVDIGPGEFPGDSFVLENDDEGGFVPNGVGYGEWQLVYPAADPAAEGAVAAWLGRLEDAVLGPDPSEMFGVLDLDSAVDWVILQELTKNNDAYLLSVHLAKDEGDALARFVPWDLDLTMGYPYPECGAEGFVPRTWWDPVAEAHVDVPFVQAMAAVPAFREALVARWHELRQGPLHEDGILERIAAYDATLAPALAANLERWPIEDIEFLSPSGDDWLCPVTSYPEEHARTVAFLRERLAWLDASVGEF